MDPNANLAEQRLLCARLNVGDSTDEQACLDASRLADLVEALDEWIMGGGFLPSAWIKGQGRNR